MGEREPATQAGVITKNVREDLERQLGRSVISSERASDHLRPIDDTSSQELPFDNTDKGDNQYNSILRCPR